MLILLAFALLGPGPLSKFDDHKVVADFETTATIGDVERCLIDLDGPGLATVFRQPDRPDRVQIVWAVHGPLSAPVASRIDLVATASGGTHVKSWLPKKWTEQCAPPNG